MDYIKEIVSLLRKLDIEKLKCVYAFVRGITD